MSLCQLISNDRLPPPELQRVGRRPLLRRRNAESMLTLCIADREPGLRTGSSLLPDHCALGAYSGLFLLACFSGPVTRTTRHFYLQIAPKRKSGEILGQASMRKQRQQQ